MPSETLLTAQACRQLPLVAKQLDLAGEKLKLGRPDDVHEAYQQGRAGRHKHAARMHQWRRRRAAAAKIVTHHSSQDTPADAVLAGNESPPAIAPDSQPQSPCSPTASESIALSAIANARIGVPAPVWRCHWCQSECPALVRQGFLRHSRW